MFLFADNVDAARYSKPVVDWAIEFNQQAYVRSHPFSIDFSNPDLSTTGDIQVELHPQIFWDSQQPGHGYHEFPAGGYWKKSWVGYSYFYNWIANGWMKITLNLTPEQAAQDWKLGLRHGSQSGSMISIHTHKPFIKEYRGRTITDRFPVSALGSASEKVFTEDYFLISPSNNDSWTEGPVDIYIKLTHEANSNYYLESLWLDPVLE